jgi:hypothetical protein
MGVYRPFYGNFGPLTVPLRYAFGSPAALQRHPFGMPSALQRSSSGTRRLPAVVFPYLKIFHFAMPALRSREGTGIFNTTIIETSPPIWRENRGYAGLFPRIPARKR